MTENTKKPTKNFLIDAAEKFRRFKSSKTHTWNPLLKIPRNSPCPCQSGRKFKTCCLTKLPTSVTKEVALKFKTQMREPDLVFVTEANKERMDKIAEQKDPT